MCIRTVETHALKEERANQFPVFFPWSQGFQGLDPDGGVLSQFCIDVQTAMVWLKRKFRSFVCKRTLDVIELQVRRWRV